MIAVSENVGNAVDPKANYGQKSETPLNATDHRSLDGSIDPTTMAMLH